MERDLSIAQASLDGVTSDRDELVNARIPGLEILSYDETIQIGQRYVRNVVFTLAKKNDTASYEYRLVLSNDGLSTVIPDVQVILFDELGIQLGAARVPSDSLAAEVGFTLESGEVRTHSGAIEFFSNKSPKCFTLRID